MMRIKRRSVFIVALCLLLVINCAFSGTAWMFASALTPVNYLEDVRLYQAESIDAARAACEADGYKFVPGDLNEGSGSDVQVYLGYKTTTNSDFAVTKLAMLGMESGYQIRDYKEIAKALESKNAVTAETLYYASTEVAKLYAAGSPKALDAYEGLNLYCVDETGKEKLGDFIVNGKATIEFFTEFILMASTGTLTNVMSFLNSGLVSDKSGYDEERDVIEGNWADAVTKNELWNYVLSDSDLMTTDQKDELHRLYDDSAKRIFPRLQEFTTNYLNAVAREAGNPDGLYQIDEEYLGEGAETAEKIVDHMEDMKVEEADNTYISAYALLNKYLLPNGEALGDHIVRLGKKTSDELDITELFPIVSSMSEGQAGIISNMGLVSGVFNLSENISVFETDPEMRKMLDDTRSKIAATFPCGSIPIYTTANKSIYESKIAYTSDAVRRQSAENILAKSKSETFDEDFELIQKWVSLISGAVTVLSMVIGKLLIFLIPKIAALFIGTAAAAAATGTAIATIAGIISAISTFLFYAGIIVLIISLIVLFVRWLYNVITDMPWLAYTDMPDIVFDAADTANGTVLIQYKAVMDNNGKTGDLNGYKSNKWTCLYSTTDPDAGSPIREDETGTMFRIVKGDPNRQPGYAPLSYYGERNPGDTNSYARKNKVGGIYVSYRTEDSIAMDLPSSPVIGPEPYSGPASGTDISGTDIYDSGDEDMDDTDTAPADGGGTQTESKVDEGGASEAGQAEPLPSEQETVPADLDPGSSYIGELIVETGKDAKEAKSKITKKTNKFYVIDINLTPGQDELFTYLGYTITDDRNKAITDIRVAPYVNAGSISFGDISYGCSGAIGVATDKSNSSTQEQCDGLFYTTDSRAGTPLHIESLHIVHSYSEAIQGWEPVTVFSGGLPYDFNTSLMTFKDEYGQSVQRTAYKTKRNYDWSQHTPMYIYYEPETMYVGGEKYLSGIFFAGGYSSDEDSKVYLTNGNVDEYFTQLSGLNGAARVDVNLLDTFRKGTVSYTTNQKRQYLYYSWSYNPYRALYDIVAYEDIPSGDGLPYNLKKARTYNSRQANPDKANETASKYDSYVACTSVYQGFIYHPEDGGSVKHNREWGITTLPYRPTRYIVGGNCFRDRYAQMESVTKNVHKYNLTTSVNDLRPTEYKGSVVSGAGLFVEGLTEGRSPLKLSDVVICPTEYEALKKNGEIFTMMPEEDTLAGTKAEGSFRPVCDVKAPNSLTPFNLANPTVIENNPHLYVTKEMKNPLYIYIKGSRSGGKYISRVFVGSMSRKQYRDSVEKWDEDNEDDIYEHVDLVVESKAILSACSEASDEVIMADISRYQSDCWYSMMDSRGFSVIDEGKEDMPSAYIGVARTDDPNEAITGMLLFKDNNKNARSYIKVKGAAYYCASISSPIYIKGEKYYLYYTYNTGVSPGRYITDITVDDKPLVSQKATVLCADRRDPEVAIDYSDVEAVAEMVKNYATPYGDPNFPSYIHLGYEHQRGTYFNKLYIGAGVTKKAAMCELISQGCAEFCDIDLNKEAGGAYMYLGFSSVTVNEEELAKLSPMMQKKKRAEAMNEVIYDIVCTVGEPYKKDGFVGKNGAFYYPVAQKNLNANNIGSEIYMYTCTPYWTTRYNTANPAAKALTVSEAFGNDPIVQLGFAQYERVPYNSALDGLASPDSPPVKWEYVMRADNKMQIDLNAGAFAFSKISSSYGISDNRISMFVQRENGSVKPSAEITGGYYAESTLLGTVYIES